MDECARGAGGSGKQHSRENEHGVETSSHSYKRSESAVCVDRGSDRPTDENVPVGNDWNVHGGGACGECDQTEGRTGSR